MLVAENGELFGTVGGGAVENLAVSEARNVLASGRNKTIDVNLKEIGMQCGGSVTLFFEAYQAVSDFVLFGGGHVGKALTPLLESMGFRVTIMDDREAVSDFADPGRGRTVIIHSYEDIEPVRERIERSGYCFVATHGHQYDYILMKQLWALSAEYRYLGLIGSSAKVSAMKKKLAEEGLIEPKRLYAPVGIPLGGDTAAEIAIAIAAEIIAVRYDRAVPHMRDPKRE
jgi:xanthine dehydrogenase accessory factor